MRAGPALALGATAWYFFHMDQADKKKAVAKRIADAAEKMGVAGMALAAYQGNILAGLFGFGIFLYSVYLTWRNA